MRGCIPYDGLLELKKFNAGKSKRLYAGKLYRTEFCDII